MLIAAQSIITASLQVIVMLAVVALGGNALLKRSEKSFDKQFLNAEKAFKNILPLTKQDLVVTHGNGPQVGNIMIRVEEALGKAYPLPLYAAVAESEGEIGFVLSQVLNNMVKNPVVSILTQVLVDPNDIAFKKPTKPVGPLYTWKEAKRLEKKGFSMAKTPKGWRRVVASPQPMRILETDIIRKIVKHSIVIAAGGGGIPVVKKKGKFHGIDGVIDKDLASACLAKSLHADTLVMLTDVDNAFLNYGTKDQCPLKKIKVKEAKKYIREGHFAEGSMLPKMKAAVEFAQTGGTAIITSFASAKKAMKRRAGTTVII